jgi:hypothetical protein
MVQKLLVQVGDCLCPLLKLGVLHLNGVLKVDDPVGIDIHLLLSDVGVGCSSTHAQPH